METNEIKLDYQIALMTDSGGWEILDDFMAADDAAANSYAEAEYALDEWYVLRNGENINA